MCLGREAFASPNVKKLGHFEDIGGGGKGHVSRADPPPKQGRGNALEISHLSRKGKKRTSLVQ